MGAKAMLALGLVLAALPREALAEVEPCPSSFRVPFFACTWSQQKRAGFCYDPQHPSSDQDHSMCLNGIEMKDDFKCPPDLPKKCLFRGSSTTTLIFIFGLVGPLCVPFVFTYKKSKLRA